MGHRLRTLHSALALLLLLACSFLLFYIFPTDDGLRSKQDITPNQTNVVFKVWSPTKNTSTTGDSPIDLSEKIAYIANSSLLLKQIKSDVLTADIYPFGHLVSIPERCPNLGAQVRILVMVATAPDHAARRMTIRRTWGSVGQRTDVTLAFIVGRSLDPKAEESLSLEQQDYGDIIQGHFLDSYRNLTLKTLSILEWTIKYCPSAKLVLKVDDDTFVNVPKLLGVLTTYETASRSVFGRVKYKARPIQDIADKFYVPPSIFNEEFYPDYELGPAYLITRDVIQELFELALVTNFFPMEDVFVTGFLVEALKIARVSKSEFLEYHSLVIASTECIIKRFVFFTELNDSELLDSWRKLFNDKSYCW